MQQTQPLQITKKDLHLIKQYKTMFKDLNSQVIAPFVNRKLQSKAAMVSQKERKTKVTETEHTDLTYFFTGYINLPLLLTESAEVIRQLTNSEGKLVPFI